MKPLLLGALLLPLLLFFGCSLKQEIQKETPKTILIKTKKTAFHQSGFVRELGDRIEILLYSNAQALLNLKIYSDSVCINSSCIAKKEFYKKYMDVEYPKNTIDSIFLGREIFDGEELKFEDGEMIQKIYKKNIYDIEYKVSQKRVLFRDKINGVTIMTRDITE